MNLEELQTARDRERQTDKLQQLRETFYADAGEFIQQLRAERDRAAERADDPFDAPEVNRLTDEINTAEGTVEAIYEKRVGKVVKAASFAAADLPAEAEGMTAEEQELFETLVADIKQNRRHVLDVLAGESDRPGDGPASAGNEPEPTDVSPEATGANPGLSAADLMGSEESTSSGRETVPPDRATDGQQPEQPADGHPPDQPGEGRGASAADAGPDGEVRSGGAAGSDDSPPHAVRNDGGQPTVAGDAARTGPGEPTGSPRPDGSRSGDPATTETAESEGGTPTVDRRTVRITDEVGTFVGSDERDYDLEPDDVVTLPESNASILIERDAATEL